MGDAQAEKKKKPGWRTVLRSLRNRKSGFMALFGFAQGLPPALFLGTLYAWLSEAEVDLETMGVFSLVGLAYAFQFLWSPLLDKVDIPGLSKLGKRKQWIAPMQLIVGIALLVMSFLDPKNALGWFSLLAAVGAFASATQDIAINAWRIDVADEVATIDILSTVYQMGYRLSSLVGGALGLIIAARIGWPETYMMMGGILLFVGAVGLFRIPQGANLSRADTSGVRSDRPGVPVVEFTSDSVVQGYVEEANVNPVMEMTRLIALQRAFESAANVVETNNQSLSEAIRTLGASS